MGEILTVLVGTRTLMREGLKGLLAGSSIKIVDEAPRLGEVADRLHRNAADLVLVDVAEFGEELDRGLRTLRAAFPALRVVLLTDLLDCQQLAVSLAAGVDGYLLKEISCEALLQSLRLVMAGQKVFPTELATLLVNGTPVAQPSRKTPSDGVRDRGLSERELQILQCLAQGDSNKTIAGRLEITEATVKVHVKSLLRKINAANRTQAAIWAVSQGLA